MKSLRGGAYESPFTNVVEIQPENVLCASVQEYGTLDDLSESTFDW